tara:strand:+ start:2387 stop:2647 length:261 start_codon:yes stop_codon:yes gene_type:complete
VQDNYLTAQVDRGNSIGVNEYQNQGESSSIPGSGAQISQVSPRGHSKNNMLEKMNVANFIKQNKHMDREENEYQKAINRQGSKKHI